MNLGGDRETALGLGMLSLPDRQTVCEALIQMALWMHVVMDWLVGLVLRHIVAPPKRIIVNLECVENSSRAEEDEVYFSTDECDDDAESGTLLDVLPYDLVVTNIWPRVIIMSTAQDICQYRLISSQWRALVSTSLQWRALQPLLVGTDLRPLWYDHGLNLDDLMYMPEYLRCEYNRPQGWYYQ